MKPEKDLDLSQLRAKVAEANRLLEEAFGLINMSENTYTTWGATISNFAKKYHDYLDNKNI